MCLEILLVGWLAKPSSSLTLPRTYTSLLLLFSHTITGETHLCRLGLKWFYFMPFSVESVNKIVVEIVQVFGFMKIQWLFCIKFMVSVLKSTKVCCWHHEHSVLVLYKVKSHFFFLNQRMLLGSSSRLVGLGNQLGTLAKSSSHQDTQVEVIS